MEIKAFRMLIVEYFQKHGRSMPWRIPEAQGFFDTYKILVSEIMLQQTQAERVKPKFEQFIDRFPDFQTLAEASFQTVLQQWSGLGYNRRAKYLHEVAKSLSGQPFPSTPEQLSVYKGIGYNTAAAVYVYSFNQPYVFIETNIRTVYIHHFFGGDEVVRDAQIEELVGTTIDREHPREFYWGLMDYGTSLKKQGIRNNSRNAHYVKQTAFEGSSRQLRGMVMRELAVSGRLSLDELQDRIVDNRLEVILQQLGAEGLIELRAGDVLLSS